MSDSKELAGFYCATYLVPPGKNQDRKLTEAQIVGSVADLNPTETNYFRSKLTDDLSEYRTRIIFSPLPDGTKSNETRDLIHGLAFGDIDEKNRCSRELAVRLSEVTDNRSGTGLFIALSGQVGENTRVALLRLRANVSLHARIVETSIVIALIESAFSDNDRYLKAAVFDGQNNQSDLWKGRIEDRQTYHIIHDGSKMWVNDFLNARPEMTNGYATGILGKALKKIIEDKNTNKKEQSQIIVAAEAVKVKQSEQITLRAFANTFLPESIRDSFTNKVGGPAFIDTPFELDIDMLNNVLPTRSVYLDNEFRITGPIHEFERLNVIRPVSAEPDLIEVNLRGKITHQDFK